MQGPGGSIRMTYHKDAQQIVPTSSRVAESNHRKFEQTIRNSNRILESSKKGTQETIRRPSGTSQSSPRSSEQTVRRPSGTSQSSLKSSEQTVRRPSGTSQSSHKSSQGTAPRPSGISQTYQRIVRQSARLSEKYPTEETKRKLSLNPRTSRRFSPKSEPTSTRTTQTYQRVSQRSDRSDSRKSQPYPTNYHQILQIPNRISRLYTTNADEGERSPGRISPTYPEAVSQTASIITRLSERYPTEQTKWSLSSSPRTSDGVSQISELTYLSIPQTYRRDSERSDSHSSRRISFASNLENRPPTSRYDFHYEGSNHSNVAKESSHVKGKSSLEISNSSTSINDFTKSEVIQNIDVFETPKRNSTTEKFSSSKRKIVVFGTPTYSGRSQKLTASKRKRLHSSRSSKKRKVFVPREQPTAIGNNRFVSRPLSEEVQRRIKLAVNPASAMFAPSQRTQYAQSCQRGHFAMSKEKRTQPYGHARRTLKMEPYMGVSCKSRKSARMAPGAIIAFRRPPSWHRRKIVQSDPVALHSYYERNWTTRFKHRFPGESRHSEVRWCTRHSLLEPKY